MVERSASADAKRRKSLAVLRAELNDIEKAVRALMVTDHKLAAFATLIRLRFRDSPDPSLRKRYVQAFCRRSHYDQRTANIPGPTSSAASAALAAEDLDPDAVRTSVSGWRAPPGDDENYVYAIAL